MAAPPRIVVIGSGPAGVSASWPLVERGLPVTLIDSGMRQRPVERARPALFDLRHGEDVAARWLMGGEAEAVRGMMAVSPKLRTAADRDFTRGYLERNRIDAGTFTANGSLYAGGLSNIWGAAVAMFDDRDLAPFPISTHDLAPSYRAIAARIGISGSVDDPMGRVNGADIPLQAAPPLSGPVASIWNQGTRPGTATDRVTLGLARNAVITEDMGDRRACRRDKACMWGCPTGAIYSSVFDLEALIRHKHFHYEPGSVVSAIAPRDDRYEIRMSDAEGGRSRSTTADIVILAAGTIATTRLALDCLGTSEPTRRRLQYNPAFSFALLVPRSLGSAEAREGVGFAQLSFRVAIDGDAYAFGLLFNAESFAPSDLIGALPLTTVGGVGFVREVASALCIGICYLPGESSDAAATVSPSELGAVLRISHREPEGVEAAKRRLTRDLSAAFARHGAYLVPGSSRLLGAGADSHYASTLPMGEMTSARGELAGVPGVYVVDGAALTSLPAKPLTFSVMANADRIGRIIADSIAAA